MNKTDVEIRCRQKASELLEEHFPNFIKEAAVVRPEVLKDSYDNELPHKIAATYKSWLSGLWTEIASPNDKDFKQCMNQQGSIEMVSMSYDPHLASARQDAKSISLWERITKTNHEDVTHYKGLLKQYAEDLLEVLIQDFLKEI